MKPKALSGIARRLQRLLGTAPPPPNRFLDMPDVAPADKALIESVRPYTMTSPERLFALIEAVRYVVRRRIPGAFVECGVWKGGSVLAMLKTLQALGVTDREVYLFDTFEGMTAPTERDVSPFSDPALASWKEAQGASGKAWNALFSPELFSLEHVRKVLTDSGYPSARLHCVQGRVEDTLPQHAPSEIALLRLDTDWYESTRHEMLHLYPRLRSGGPLIIDDYGHWHGCRDAVDEYFAGADATPVLLQRIDYTGRLILKP